MEELSGSEPTDSRIPFTRVKNVLGKLALAMLSITACGPVLSSTPYEILPPVCPIGDNLVHQPDDATVNIRVFSSHGNISNHSVTFPWRNGISQTLTFNGVIVPLQILPLTCDLPPAT